ncbi:MAG TPA: hypothetical protein VGK48_25805 [Terriglobia bacterium]|jgi:hypothetical protein
MITLRSEQVRALRASSVYAHIPSLIRHVQQFHAGKIPQLGAESVDSFVTRAAEAAAAHELYSEQALARFVDIAIVKGLPLPPAIEEILRQDSPASPPERLEKAWRSLLFELEAEA